MKVARTLTSDSGFRRLLGARPRQILKDRPEFPAIA